MEGQTIRKFTNEERLKFAQSNVSKKRYNDIHPTARIGKHCAIGGDGFGYAKDKDGTLVKMPHKGNVIICKGVEIGSNVCIDRAVEGSTVIGEGTKIDNLVHIAHGVKIGKNCLIVAGTVIGGSCDIGDNCFIGINVSIKNKVRIGNNVTIGMGAVVLKDVPDNCTVVGNPARIIKIV
jgi:UDP-3-O-[3-hydroxymyristoyl] glucosamine N-acyltransferase